MMLSGFSFSAQELFCVEKYVILLLNEKSMCLCTIFLKIFFKKSIEFSNKKCVNSSKLLGSMALLLQPYFIFLTKEVFMYAVTGASGQLGRLVVEGLLKTVPPSSIVAFVRNPHKVQDLAEKGVQVRQADYTDPSSWAAALQGVKRLLLISGMDIGQRVVQHKAVIDAAAAAHVELLAYTSVLHADRSSLFLAQEHRETEALIKASGIPYTLLRNGWYTENYLGSIQPALQYGAVFGAAGAGRIASATRADYAEAAAVVLQTPLEHILPIYELAGDQAYTLAEFAEALTRQVGKPIVYNNLPESEYKDMLTQVGLPEGFAAVIAQSDIAASQGALFDDSHTLSGLIGRPTQSLEYSIKVALAQ
jgi:NAD(P)H dehydrogenase (quinone)